MNKPLCDMSFAELHVELAAATAQYQAAEFQDQMRHMMAQQQAATARKEAVMREIDLRLSRLAAAGGVPAPGAPVEEEQKHGG